MLCIDCIDTRVSKRKIIKLCNELDMLIDETPFTNVNGGKYLRVYNDKCTAKADIYYKSFMNNILYDKYAKAGKDELIKRLKEIKTYE